MSLPLTMELRKALLNLQQRDDGEKSYFTGDVAVYNTWSEVLYDCFREKLAPGCFDESLASERDIPATIDHDFNRILGRTRSKTLALISDQDRLRAEVQFSAYSYAQDLKEAIKRQDLQGMSFMFDVREDLWEFKEGVSCRTVIKADIYEVSFVFSPAYESTTVGMRGAPIALPIAGEERARKQALSTSYKALSYRRNRLRLAEV